jgi:two-component system NtrC family sensor kinase
LPRGGRPRSVIALEKAVETLKTTQAQLIQSEKLSAVGQFVAGVTHELNNPLTAVIGFADLLSSIETSDKSRHHLEVIARSARRCHKIVQSLLGFARQKFLSRCARTCLSKPFAIEAFRAAVAKMAQGK